MGGLHVGNVVVVVDGIEEVDTGGWVVVTGSVAVVVVSGTEEVVVLDEEEAANAGVGEPANPDMKSSPVPRTKRSTPTAATREERLRK
jgi:hypothetical protein